MACGEWHQVISLAWRGEGTGGSARAQVAGLELERLLSWDRVRWGQEQLAILAKAVLELCNGNGDGADGGWG